MDKNEIPTAQQILHVSITTKISQVILCGEIITVSFTNQTKHFTHSVQSMELFIVEAGATCQLLPYLKDLKYEFHVHLACCH